MAIAIGDIHGCLNSLKQLLAKLPTDAELVFLGDYIDRGPDSAGVIKYLEDLSRDRPCRLLKGNHELMMHRAIHNEKDVSIWLFNGGEATLESYQLTPGDWKQYRDKAAPLAGFQRFYDSLLSYYEDEQTIYVHAGIDISLPDMSQQTQEVMLWIRDRFYLKASQWQGKQVVFGHTPTQSMGLTANKIFQKHRFFGVDTGCVYGGRLTGIDTSTHEIYQVAGYNFTRRR